MARWKLSVPSIVPAVGVAVGVLVAVAVGVGVGVGVGVAVGVGEPDPPGTSAWKEVTVAVPLWVRKRIPQKPDVRLLSLVVTIQPLGSEPGEAQTLAVNVEPTTRKWMV